MLVCRNAFPDTGSRVYSRLESPRDPDASANAIPNAAPDDFGRCADSCSNTSAQRGSNARADGFVSDAEHAFLAMQPSGRL
jgi:hypothetical protein